MGDMNEPKAAERPKEVPLLMGLLSDKVEEAQNSLIGIESRVNSVMVSFPIDEAKRAEEPASTELGKSIQSLIERVSHLAERMENVASAIEL